ncbi:MAG TPA: S41 family peptidase, partial [Acidobacteriota bacterium]|nr:S41 family peptidase [Acidobacteriota bacterium]
MTDIKSETAIGAAKPHPERADHSPPPRAVGMVALALMVGLLVVSAAWIARDKRFKGSRILTAAAITIMEEAFTAPAPDVMFRAGAAGLTADLDPFSGYLPPAEFGWFTEEAEGEYVGIGVEISASARGLIVVHVFPRSPAGAAMVRPGDRIIRIDDVSTFGMTSTEAASLMRGRVASDVEIEVVTPTGEVRSITLVRDRVEVTAFPIVGISRSGAAYIRWTQFSAGSGDQLAALAADLAIQDPTGMILDLRGNPGGILDEAVAAAGVFLPPDQLICRLADRDFATQIEYRAVSTPPAFSGPLVIVCDEASASASEILAAALWEAGRAVVVGRRTFGKGWVQSILPLD